MAFAVPAQARPPAHASAARGLPRADGLSAAAQALAPKKASGFLLLFRKIAEAAGAKGSRASRASGPALEAGEAPRKKTRTADASESAGQTDNARRTAGARRPRRGKAPFEAEQSRSAMEVPATPAPARRASQAAPQEAAPAAAEAGRQPRPAQVRVFVVDLRARPAAAETRSEGRKISGAPERENAPRSSERVLLAREAGTAAQSPLPASWPGSSPTSTTSLSGSASPAASALGSLRERLLPEVVERVGIVLREGGEGEIRLVLKPEHLGSVRIRLHLGESSLEGRIVVDNSNVKELLDASLEQLKSALRQEGYASANIDVTVSGEGGQRREVDPGRAPPVASPAEEFERATPVILDLGFTTVNLFV